MEKKELLNALNTYCEAIVSSLNTENIIYAWGTAVCIRKAMELMGAYMLYQETGGKTTLKEGQYVARNIANRGLSPTVQDFAKSFSPLYRDLSKTLHYQNYKNEKQGAAEEIGQLKEDALQIGYSLHSFSAQVDSFYTLLNLDRNSMPQYIRAVLDYQNYDNNSFAFNRFRLPCERFLNDMNIQCWDDFYTCVSMKLSNSIFTNNRTALQASIPLYVLFGNMVLHRMMAEKLGSVLLCPKFVDTENVTLGDYTKEMQTVPDRYKKNHTKPIWTNLRNNLTYIQDATNTFAHWSAESEDTPQLNEKLKTDYFNRFDTTNNCIYSLMKNDVFEAALQTRSTHVQSWFQANQRSELRYKEEKEKLDKQLKYERFIVKLQWCGFIGIFAIFAHFITIDVIAYKRVAAYHSPSNIESLTEVQNAQLFETPELDVYITGVDSVLDSDDDLFSYAGATYQKLMPDEVKAFYVGSGKDHHDIQYLMNAECKEQYALHFSKNEEFMREIIQTQTNTDGIAKLTYCLYKTNAYGAEQVKYGSWKHLGGTYLTTTQQYAMDSAGWYELRVQALGASDGYTSDDGLVRSTTGWQSYRFLVLPSNLTTGLAYTVENLSDKNIDSRESTTLTAQCGDRINLRVNPVLTDGAYFVYSWDNASQEAKPDEDGIIVVPKSMTPGYHSLNIQVCYTDGNRVFKPTAEGYMASIPCNIKQHKVEKNVSITLKDENGIVVPDGGKYIYTAGKAMDLSVFAKNSTAGIVFSHINIETGKKTILLENPELGTGKYKINNAYKGDYLYKIEVFGKQYSGSSDSNEYASLSFTPYAKTHTNEYDDYKNITREWVFGDTGSNLPTGYIRYVYTYDEDARIQTKDITYWSMDDKPVLNQSGYHRVYREYFGVGGQLNGTWYYGVSGELVLVDGYAGWITEYLDDGCTRHHRIGIDGEPIQASPNNSYYYVLKCDERKNVLEEYSYDADGLPMLTTNGWFAYFSLYDDYDNEIEKWFWDTDGKPCDTAYGYAHAYYTYDQYGNLREFKSYRADGSLIKRYKQDFVDKTDKLRYRVYLDDEGNKVLSEKYGYASVEDRFDPVSGERMERLYCDENGHLTPCSDGYARIDGSFENGHIVKMEYQDADKKPVAGPERYATVICKRDNYGNIQERCYYDADGEPVNPDGVNLNAARSIKDWEYINGKWRVKREFYYGANGAPKEMYKGRGYFGKEYMYTDQATVSFFLDADGNKTAAWYDDTCFDRRETKYNNDGHATQELRYNGNDLADGLYRIEWDYDGDQNISSTEWHSDDPDTPADDPYFIVFRYGIDPWNKEQYTESYARYDVSGNKLCDQYGLWRCDSKRSYDKASGVYTKGLEYYDIYNQPMQSPYGEDYARRTITYYVDTVSNITDPDKFDYEVRYYGTDGTLMEHIPNAHSSYIDSTRGARIVHRSAFIDQNTREYSIKAYNVRNEVISED